jgi:hypothetical protein
MLYLFKFNQLNFNFNPKQIYLSRSWSSQKISDDSQPNSKNLMRPLARSSISSCITPLLVIQLRYSLKRSVAWTMHEIESENWKDNICETINVTAVVFLVIKHMSYLRLINWTSTSTHQKFISVKVGAARKYQVQQKPNASTHLWRRAAQSHLMLHHSSASY